MIGTSSTSTNGSTNTSRPPVFFGQPEAHSNAQAAAAAVTALIRNQQIQQQRQHHSGTNSLSNSTLHSPHTQNGQNGQNPHHTQQQPITGQVNGLNPAHATHHHHHHQAGTPVSAPNHQPSAHNSQGNQYHRSPVSPTPMSCHQDSHGKPFFQKLTSIINFCDK